MIIKKFIEHPAHQVECLFDYNFVIFYIPGKGNSQAYKFIHRPTNTFGNNHNDWQYHLLQIVLTLKKLEIGSIEIKNTNIIPEKIIEQN